MNKNVICRQPIHS